MLDKHLLRGSILFTSLVLISSAYALPVTVSLHNAAFQAKICSLHIKESHRIDCRTLFWSGNFSTYVTNDNYQTDILCIAVDKTGFWHTRNWYYIPRSYNDDPVYITLSGTTLTTSPQVSNKWLLKLDGYYASGDSSCFRPKP